MCYLVVGALSVPAGLALFRLPRLVMPLFFAVGVGEYNGTSQFKLLRAI